MDSENEGGRMAEEILDLAYMICTTPRTGSTALMKALESSGVAGIPAEYPDAVSSSGVFGTMVHASQVHDSLMLPLAKRQAYIHLYREDLVFQAVSWVMASQTGRWHSHHKAVDEVIYDPDGISKGVERIRLDNLMWSDWLEGKSPVLRISYETLSLNYRIGTQEILKFLGLPKRKIVPKLLKIGTGRNIEWVEKWKEDNK